MPSPQMAETVCYLSKDAFGPNANLSSRTCQREETAHPSVHRTDSLRLTKAGGVKVICVYSPSTRKLEIQEFKVSLN